MPPRISPELANAICSKLTIGVEPLDVAAQYPEVHRSTVYRLWRSMRILGSPYSLVCLALAGRPRLITSGIEEDLVDLLSTRSTLYLDEIAYHLLVNYDLHISNATISNTLKRIDFSCKVTQRVAAQRDENKRAEYWETLQTYAAEQLVFVDESAANEQTLDRKYG